MGVFGDQDIPELMKDMSVPVVAGAVTDRGIVDRDGELAFPGDMAGLVGVKIVVYVQASRFSALQSGGALTVDGTGYIAREVRPFGDGALLAVACGLPP